MMRNIFLCPIAALAVISAACGGGPTSPSPLASQNAAPTVATPAPVPDPVPPSPSPAPSPDPAPAPPTPTPAPAPPAPAPDPGTRFTAHVDSSHWYGEPLFGSTFELTRFKDRITFASITLPILYQDDRGFIAKNSEMTFSVLDSTWTFNGIAGTGSGTLSK